MTRPRILLDLTPELRAELFDEERLDRLAELGDVECFRAATAEERFGYEVVVTGWGSATFPGRRLSGDRLQLIAHSAGTIRSMVPRSLMADGVRVSQAASGMAVSVAELALYLTQALLRNLHTVDRRMRAHDWRGAHDLPLGRTVAGAQIGVIGASRVGRAYIEHLTAMGADVVVSDPYLARRDADEMGVELMGLDDLLRTSEVVALHAPVTDETRGMLSAERLAMIPDGGVFVNTARSVIVDNDALLAELQRGRLSAALDVFDIEPLPEDHAIWDLPNVIMTPHIGAYTRHSRRTQADVVIDEIDRFLSESSLVFEVNADNYDHLA